MKKCAIWITLVACLIGCSTKVGYYFLDWAIEWKLEEYVSLNDSQQSQFDTLLDKFLRWHRNDELVRYEQHLAKIAIEIQQQSLTPKLWREHVQQAKGHWLRTFEFIKPKLVPLVASFSDQQVAQIIAQLKVDEVELNQKYLNKDQQELVEMADERITKRVKQWLGKLSSEQEQAIHQYNVNRGSTLDMWLEYRHEWIRLFSQTLKNRHNTAALSHSLSVLMTQPDSLKSDAYQAALDKNTNEFGQLLILLNQQATEKQRRHFQNKLSGLQQDLIELSESDE
ncbi:DUF6279 family lipoprotein [Shewanella sp. 10N.261.52.F9]|uniref:DUF6279 family lipoprotein n=1 Tax=Shewanella sp. 10N.261.52.F9 TaxID=3229684 RepID=UPI00354CC7B4